MLDPAGAPGDAVDEIADGGRVGAGKTDEDVEARDVFAALDLVELGAGEGGAFGGLLLVEAGELPGAVEVVCEAGEGLEGERRLGARACGHRELFEVSADAGLSTGGSSVLPRAGPFRSTISHEPGTTIS